MEKSGNVELQAPPKITTRSCFAPGALFTRRRLSFFLSTNVFKKKKKKKNRSCPAFAFADGRIHPEEETMEEEALEWKSDFEPLAS